MRCNPLRWLWGVIPIVVLGWIAMYAERPRIEADLGTRAKSALESRGLGWAVAGFAGRDADLEGLAAEDGERAQAAEIVRNVWGARTIENRTALIDEEPNYTWAASLREGNKLRFTGFVPNEGARRAIVGAAKATFPSLEIDDRTKLARGLANPDAWLAGVSFALKQLDGLEVGARAGLEGGSGTSLAISGEAESLKAYRAIKAAISGNLPPGITLKSDAVRPPAARPFVWGAKVQDKRVELTGSAPTDEARRELVALVRGVLAGFEIEDRTQPASGEPKDFAAAAAAAVDVLGGLAEPIVELRDATLALGGVAASEAAADAVRRQLQSKLPPSFRLTDRIRIAEPVLPTPRPFRTAISIAAGAITLEGAVPPDPARERLVDLARAAAPGSGTVDQLQPSAGAPAEWVACIEAGLAGLRTLGGGRLVLSDRSLELEGEARDEGIAARLSGELRSAAAGCAVETRVTVAPPPEPSLSWRARRSADGVVIDGEVPRAEVKASLAASARSLFPTLSVTDAMRVADVQPGRWPGVASSLLRQLSRLRSGEAIIAGGAVTISGEAAEEGIAQSIRTALASDLAAGYTGRAELTIRTDAMIAAEIEARRRIDDDIRRRADEEIKRRAEEARLAAITPQQRVEANQCQTEINAISQTGVITFDSGSAEIEAESLPMLNRLVRVARTCPTARIEIAGHTDTEGASDRNQRLSEQRAQAVAAYLVRAGVGSERVRSAGFGETRPIASNDKPEQRARNRRIEFVVTP